MHLLMDTGDRLEVVSNETIMLPDETTRLIFTTETGGHIVLEVTEDDLVTLAQSCANTVANLSEARRIIKARKN